MVSDPEKLNRTVAELQTELAQVDALDPNLAQRLRTTLAEVQSALNGPERPATQRRPAPTAVERLGEAALRLEESHPALSTAIGNLAGTLGQMGF